MNISGIRPSDGFYEKNIRKLNEEVTPEVSDVKEIQQVSEPAISFDKDIAVSLTISEAGKAAAKNIEKAVINMKKDTTIHRYQYFVQNKQTPSDTQSNTGLENFTL